jgi:hypothetical protein
MKGRHDKSRKLSGPFKLIAYFGIPSVTGSNVQRIPSFARRGKGRFYYISSKPLQPPLAKGRILNTHN